MGAVADFIDDIVDVITDIADAIWDKVLQIGKWVEDQLGWVNLAVIIILIIAVIVTWGYALAYYEGAMLSAVMAEGGALSGASLVAAQAAATALAIKAAFSAFLAAIYFDVILAVHNIAYLISPQYREMFQKVINEIANISQLLGLGPSFIVLALENARTLVLTTSGIFGMKYDLAQIQWLSILSNYLKEFAGKAEGYKNNPGLLLQDMADSINRPIMNQMGSYMQVLIGTIESITDNAAKLALSLTKVRTDLDNFIEDLPQNIKNQIKPYTDPIIKQFDDFIRYDFKPSLNIINGVLGVLEVKQKDIKLRVDNTINRLLYPGRYLHEIDDRTGDELTDQEYSISEVSNRPQRKVFEGIEKQGNIIEEGLKTVREALDSILPTPPYEIPEVVAPITVKQLEMVEYKTWFVGDY